MTARFRRDPDFIDRPELAMLENKMSLPGTRAALVGLGGIGWVAYALTSELPADHLEEVAACDRILLPCPRQGSGHSGAVATRKQRGAF